MEQRTRQTFYLLWMLAILVCAVLALVTALIVSFTRAPAAVEAPLPAAAGEAPEDAVIIFDNVTEAIPAENSAVPEAEDDGESGEGEDEDNAGDGDTEDESPDGGEGETAGDAAPDEQ